MGLAFVLIHMLSLLALCTAYTWQERWFDAMPIDHFSYSDGRSFKLRYLLNADHWQSGGPIFFYTGNEGDIEMFANNTGFMWDLAPEFGAMVVFAEHRYYGRSLPFGEASYKSRANLGKLSSEQALADYAVLLHALQPATGRRSPVVAFGGSYGGMLAAWLRVKYAHLVDGAIAASAPVRQFVNATPCWTFDSIVTRVFGDSGVGCERSVAKSWPALRRLAHSVSGRVWLNKAFNLCSSSLLKRSADVDYLIDWLVDVWGNLAMVNYPYETNFLAPVPGWPVKAACTHMTTPNASDKALVVSIFNGVSVFLNYTGQTDCFNVKQDASPKLGENGWDYQSCTEMVMPMCSNGSGMFEEQKWSLAEYERGCRARYFNTAPRPAWAMTNYGGARLQAASNIVFR